MSGVTAMGVLATAAVVGVGVSAYSAMEQNSSAKKGLDQQKQAQEQAVKDANRQQQTSEQNINRATSKSADVGAILSASEQASKGGAAGTMLTGSQGVDPTGLALGKNTLLGS